MTPMEIAKAIGELSVRDLARLNAILRDEGMDGLVGVREPRRPKPEAPGGEMAVGEWPEPKPLPADYWESAE